MPTSLWKKALIGLWYTIALVGLNATMPFMTPGKLFAIIFLLILVDLLLPRYGFVLNILISLFLLHGYYSTGNIFNTDWLAWLVQDVSADLVAISNGGFEVVGATAAVLTLAVIIFMQVVFTRLFLRGRAITLFLGLGLALLSASYVWQGAGSFWYTVIFALLGLIIKATVPLESDSSLSVTRWLRNIVILVMALASFAAALPAPQVDLSDWLEGEARRRELIASKAGYSSFDGSLGAPLIENETPVLQVFSSEPVYLRGETRFSYTGKGWAYQTETSVEIPAESEPTTLSGKRVEMTLQALSSSRILFAPRYTLDIDAPSAYRTMRPARIDVGEHPHEYYTYQTNLAEGDTYNLIVFLPVDDPNYLRQLSNTGADFAYTTQKNITEPVRQLAQSVVAGKKNSYDKAVALETYLRYGKWSYSLDSDPPLAGEDFVEDFLFNRYSGYCVHFSTAFVVMARAVGLPARWVKGYSYGIRQPDGSFLVLANHAHTWAEVWFSDYGWVPFEPTPGGARLRTDIDNTNPGETDSPVSGEPDPLEPVEQPNDDPQGERPSSPSSSHRQLWGWKQYIAIGATLIVIILLTILLRGLGRGSMEKLYRRLQTRLRLFGWQRHQWETPREHLDRVAALPARQELLAFVHQFEDSVYGCTRKASNKPGLGRHYSLLGLLIHRFARPRVQK